MFNAQAFRQQFPFLAQPMVYLDSSSTALKPHCLAEITTRYYTETTATALRSMHQYALDTTAMIEEARSLVAERINAPTFDTIVWTKGTTESLNLIAQSYARDRLKVGDEIIVSEIEHHSNLIPWLMVAQQTGARVVKWPLTPEQTLDLETFKKLLNEKTRLVAVSQMSNVTGYQPDIAAITALAHHYRALVVVDGAQGVVHCPLNVAQLDIDFYAFSAHKYYGPTGLGVLYAKPTLLAAMAPWQGGGKMLKSASFSGFIAEESPYKFEAGTPNIAAILGFYAVLNWLKMWDQQAADHYTSELVDYAQTQLQTISGLTCYRAPHSPILSFSLTDIHPNDIAFLLAEQNIAIRTGELCAQPLIEALGCNGVVRASFLPYNNYHDVERLVAALHDAISLLGE